MVHQSVFDKNKKIVITVAIPSAVRNFTIIQTNHLSLYIALQNTRKNC